MGFINKRSLRKNWIYASRLFRKDFKFLKLKKKFQVYEQKYPGNGTLEASMVSVFQCCPEGPCSILLQRIPKYHHFSSIFVGWCKFAMERAHIFRLSRYCYKCCKSHICSGSLMSKMEYKDLDTLGICWTIHWML